MRHSFWCGYFGEWWCSIKELKRRNRMEEKVMSSILSMLNLRWKYSKSSGNWSQGKRQPSGHCTASGSC